MPVEIARWKIEGYQDRMTRGRLEIRRDRLLSFLAVFEFDLAIFHEDDIDCDLPGGWVDEGREDLRTWRVWTAEGIARRVRGVLRAVTVLIHPSLEKVAGQSDEEDRSGFMYPIGMDATTGKEIRVSHPPHEFLTDVYFREAVLEKYYADPSVYEVEDTLIRGGRHWTLPIAKTGRGTIQVWLGDIARLPRSVQQHWQVYAVVDDGGVPEWRIRTDFFAQFVDVPAEGPVARLKKAIAEANTVSKARYGEPLYASPDAMHGAGINALRVPPNPSMEAFIHQIGPLALLVVDHLNPEFLRAANAPGAEGTLNRLAFLIRDLVGTTDAEAKKMIGGLYAIQAIRSTLVVHRAGEKAAKALERAGIHSYDLREGFRDLVERAAVSIEMVKEIVAKTTGG